MPPKVDLEKVSEIIAEVAAAKIEPRFQTLKDHEISMKSGPTDLVTVADTEAEEELTKIFKDILPGSYVVGEEAVSREETNMSQLATEDGYIWVIDPVDGTHNFAHGKEKFGTIVALVHSGEVIQSWIYDIPQKRFAIAERGSGVEINSQKRVYPQMGGALKDTRGFISRKFLPEKMQIELKPVLDEHFGNVETYLCCAHEYLDILEGDSYFSMYSRIRPWDHLAGAMMLEEAGGYVRKWDESLYRPGDERGGLICAPSEEIWREIYGHLLSGF